MTINPETDPTLVTGAWREGDPSGTRTFALIGDLPLESGFVLPAVHLAYETWGTFDGANAVLILHALTADSHVVGPAGVGHASPGWWEGIVGPGNAIDTDRFFVVAANILGGCQGSTGPSSPATGGEAWGGSFPYITVRDQVRAEAELANTLGVGRWYGVVGGSAGGMRAIEWAVEWPERVERLFLLATSAAASAEQIALSSIQVDTIRADPFYSSGDYYNGPAGPLDGLDIARRIAHLSYRSEFELADRFGRSPQDDEVIGDGGRFAIESYLQHHGAKLLKRFDANSYIVLSEAMNSHDVGRGRGGIEAALARVTARTLIAGIDSDRLYPVIQQQQLAAGIATSLPIEIVKSPHGHDGFLIETDQVGELARKLLD